MPDGWFRKIAGVLILTMAVGAIACDRVAATSQRNQPPSELGVLPAPELSSGPSPTVAAPVPTSTPVAAATPRASLVDGVTAGTLLGRSAATPTPVARRAVWEIVRQAIDQEPGRWGVAVRDLETGETFVHAGDEYFPAASLYKLLVMYAVFRDAVPLDEVIVARPEHMVEAEHDEPIDPGDRLTVERTMELMITLSSNSAAHMLAERVGWQRLNELCDELKLERTGLPIGERANDFDDWRSEMSSTSPNDLLTFFTSLHERKLVSREASDQMLALLEKQQISNRLPARLPNEAVVAHKTGNLVGVVNDAGIITGPTGRFIVIALSHETDEERATDVQAYLARELYEALAEGPSSGAEARAP